MATLHIDFAERGYDITVQRGALKRAGEYFNLDRKVFIVTDSGVPHEYAEAVAACAKESMIVAVEQGEGSKSPECFAMLCKRMLDFGMTRTDCAVAVGGGVVGDLTGFAAACFMRGIDFYNVPTTLLSQVDSSIGGKTAINVGGIKNAVGAFYQPRGVLIDADTLRSLPKRQIANGMAEAIKMAVTLDKDLFEEIEREGVSEENIEKIIIGSLKIKKQIVEADERESGIRRVLNFGHTLGHGIEADENLHGLYHGECVALGMRAVSSERVWARLSLLLHRVGLPTAYERDIDRALSFVAHDKKCDGDNVSIVFSDEIGAYRIEKMPVSDFQRLVKERWA